MNQTEEVSTKGNSNVPHVVDLTVEEQNEGDASAARSATWPTVDNPRESDFLKNDVKTAKIDEPPVRRSPRKTSKEAQQRVIEAARGPTRARKKNDAAARPSEEAEVVMVPEKSESVSTAPLVRRSLRKKDKESDSSELSGAEVKHVELETKQEKKKPGRKPLNSPSQHNLKRGGKKTIDDASQGKVITKARGRRSTKSPGRGSENLSKNIDSSSAKKNGYAKEGDNDTGTKQKSHSNLFDSIKTGEIDTLSDNGESPDSVKQKSVGDEKEDTDDSEESDLDDGELDDDDDSDFDPEEDPHKLYCICNKPHGNRFMICCDKCEDWFHGDCVGITITRGREMDKNEEEWICPKCLGHTGNKKWSSKSETATGLKGERGGRNGAADKVKFERKTEGMIVKRGSGKPGSQAVDAGSGHRYRIRGSHSKEHDPSAEQGEKESKKQDKVVKGEKTSSDEAKFHPHDKKEFDEGQKLSSAGSAPKENVSLSKEKRELKGDMAPRRRSLEESLFVKEIKPEKAKDKSKDQKLGTKQEVSFLESTFTYDKVKDFKLKRQHSLDAATDVAEKKPKEAMKGQNDAFGHSVEDEMEGSNEIPRKTKLSEQRFRIPKKVRTTPTPKAHKPVNTVRPCIAAGCQKHALKSAVYCSSKCIVKHTEACLMLLEEERQRKFGSPLSDVAKLPGDVPKGLQGGESSTDNASSSCKLHANDRIAVVEKSSGKLMAGVMAPTKEKLIQWLEEHPMYEVLTTGKAVSTPKKEKKDQDDIVRGNVRRSLKETLLARCREVDLTVNIEEVSKLSQVIEEEMFTHFSDTGQKYKTKYRSLIFNLKDNKNRVLYKRVVLGDISPEKLVRMSPEQLASSELARWREREAKHNLEMIKKREEEEATMSKHAVKKTHKGEIEIDQDENLAETLEVKADVLEESNRAAGGEGGLVLEDTTEQHVTHLFDLNCRICTGKLTPPGEKPAVTTGHVTATITETVTEGSVPSPTEDYSKQISPGLSEFNERGDLPHLSKETAVWKGFIMMQNVSKFVTRAYRVSGNCDNLLQILPDTIHVCGRIPHEEVWDYLYQLKSSTNKVIDVLRFEMASADEKAGYVALYSYFYTRKRIGVVGNCYSGVKDMYLVPLASHDPVPPELKPFDGPGLPTPRPHMLLGVIIRLRQSAPKRTKSHGEKHESAKKKRKSSLCTPPDSPNGPLDQIIYGQGQSKKTSSKSSASSESSSTPTPDLGSPGSTSLGSTIPSPSPASSKALSVAGHSNVKDSLALSSVVGVSPSVSETPNLPSILTDMIAPIASLSSKPIIETPVDKTEHERLAAHSTPATLQPHAVPLIPVESSASSYTLTTVTPVSSLGGSSTTSMIELLSNVVGSSSSAAVVPPQQYLEPYSSKEDHSTHTSAFTESSTPPLNPKPVAQACSEHKESKSKSAEEEPYDPEDDFVIDLIEDIPIPTSKDKKTLPLPLDVLKKSSDKPLPALPPLPLPNLDQGNQFGNTVTSFSSPYSRAQSLPGYGIARGPLSDPGQSMDPLGRFNRGFAPCNVPEHETGHTSPGFMPGPRSDYRSGIGIGSSPEPGRAAGQVHRDRSGSDPLFPSGHWLGRGQGQGRNEPEEGSPHGFRHSLERSTTQPSWRDPSLEFEHGLGPNTGQRSRIDPGPDNNSDRYSGHETVMHTKPLSSVATNISPEPVRSHQELLVGNRVVPPTSFATQTISLPHSSRHDTFRPITHPGVPSSDRRLLDFPQKQDQTLSAGGHIASHHGQPLVLDTETSEPDIVPVSPVSSTAPEPRAWGQDFAKFPRLDYVSPPPQVQGQTQSIANEVHSFLRETRRTQDDTDMAHDSEIRHPQATEERSKYAANIHSGRPRDMREHLSRDTDQREYIRPGWKPEQEVIRDRHNHHLRQEEFTRQDGPRSHDLREPHHSREYHRVGPPLHEIHARDEWQREPRHMRRLSEQSRIESDVDRQQHLPPAEQGGHRQSAHGEESREFHPSYRAHRDFAVHHQSQSKQLGSNQRQPQGQQDQLMTPHSQGNLDRRRYNDDLQSKSSDYDNIGQRERVPQFTEDRESATPHQRLQHGERGREKAPIMHHTRSGAPEQHFNSRNADHEGRSFERIGGHEDDLSMEQARPRREHYRSFDQPFPSRGGFGRARDWNHDGGRFRGHSRGRDRGRGRGHPQFQEADWEGREKSGTQQWGDPGQNRQEMPFNTNPPDQSAIHRESSHERYSRANESFVGESKFRSQTGPPHRGSRRPNERGRFQRGRPPRGPWL